MRGCRVVMARVKVFGVASQTFVILLAYRCRRCSQNTTSSPWRHPPPPLHSPLDALLATVVVRQDGRRN